MIELLILVLLVLVIYLAVGKDVGRVARPRLRNVQRKYRKYLTRNVVTPGLIFGALALLMRDIILSPFLLAVGAFLVYNRLKQAIAEAENITPRHVSQLVLAFRGAYQLEPAVFKCLLEAAKRVDEPLRSLVTTTAEIFFTTSSTQRAFDEFRRRTNDMLLHQFIYILEMSESASDASTTESLDAFVTRLRQYEELQRQVETGLASITGQTSFIQALAIVIAFVIALLPGLRNVYTGSLLGRMGYMFIMTIIVATTYYIDRQVLKLKEKTL